MERFITDEASHVEVAVSVADSQGGVVAAGDEFHWVFGGEGFSAAIAGSAVGGFEFGPSEFWVGIEGWWFLSSAVSDWGGGIFRHTVLETVPSLRFSWTR